MKQCDGVQNEGATAFTRRECMIVTLEIIGKLIGDVGG